MHIVQLLPTMVLKNGGVRGITVWRPLLSVYRLFMSVGTTDINRLYMYMSVAVGALHSFKAPKKYPRVFFESNSSFVQRNCGME